MQAPLATTVASVAFRVNSFPDYCGLLA